MSTKGWQKGLIVGASFGIVLAAIEFWNTLMTDFVAWLPVTYTSWAGGFAPYMMSALVVAIVGAIVFEQLKW